MITPHVSTFDTAQRRVVSLLQNDAYRYVKCTLFIIHVQGFFFANYENSEMNAQNLFRPLASFFLLLPNH